MRFTRSNAGGIEHLKTFDPVLMTAFPQVLQTTEFARVSGDNQFADRFEFDSFLTAELPSEPTPFNEYFCYERTRLIVYS
ncbi:MAG: hypothetical protein NVS9B12_15640 [Vulcanimicrobiaceae bacterium]